MNYFIRKNLFVLFIIMPAAVILTGMAGEKFTYTGVKVCKECHGEDAIGNQYKIWASSPHSGAYRELLSDKGIKIAAAKGISLPEKSTECLKCHATGRGEIPGIVEEGVGCEACHGPGSEYHKSSNHVDYSSRENGYRRGVKHGMYPILGIESLKLREKLCLSCHTAERPCYPENERNIYRYKIPIQTVDSLMKNDVNFRHPLRR